MLKLFPETKRSLIQIKGSYTTSEKDIYIINFLIDNINTELPAIIKKEITPSLIMENLLIKYFIKEQKITLILKIEPMKTKEVFSFLKSNPNLHEIEIIKIC